MSLSSDLLPLILWNEAHGIRLFRLSSCILPWMTSYQMEDLPDWPDIQLVSKKAAQSSSIRAEGGHGCSPLSSEGPQLQFSVTALHTQMAQGPL